MRNLIWLQMRADALRFQCDHCHKPVGEPCVNPRTDYELERQPAHVKRLQAAGYGSMVLA
jgi:hypothetical protein